MMRSLSTLLLKLAAKNAGMWHIAFSVVVILPAVVAVEEDEVHTHCVSQLECVSQFRRAFELKVVTEPQLAVFDEGPSEVHTCTHLIFEELHELEQGVRRESLYEVTDALVDSQYVLNAAGACFGIDLDHELERLHGLDLAALVRVPTPRNNIFTKDPEEMNRHVALILKARDRLQDSIKMESFSMMSDSLVEIQYEVFHAGATFGIDLERAFDIVHRANMAKLCLSEEQAQATVQWYLAKSTRYKSPAIATDGTYWRVFDSAQGKPLKCIGWKEPEFDALGIERLSRHMDL